MLYRNHDLHSEHTPLALLLDASVLSTARHLQSHTEHPPGMLRRVIPSSHSRADPNVASLSCSILLLSSGSDLPTAAMTEESCSAPMMDVFALGQVKRRRGE